MSVYVDQSIWPYKRMKMCHMIADTPEELHAMAKLIDMKFEWFQDHPDHPHYDLSIRKRKLAVSFGAIELTARQMVETNRRIRNKGKEDCNERISCEDRYPV